MTKPAGVALQLIGAVFLFSAFLAYREPGGTPFLWAIIGVALVLVGRIPAGRSQKRD